MKRFMFIAAGASLALMFVFFIIMVNVRVVATQNVFLTLGITAMTICYHFTIRLVIGGIMDRLKLSNFQPSAWRFRERKFEKKLYKTIRVKKWKKFAPTYDDSKFDLSHSTTENVIGETCRAESVHWMCAAASLASITFAAIFESLPAFLITGIAGALFDLLFVIIQRYNRPRLIRYAAKQRTVDSKE